MDQWQQTMGIQAKTNVPLVSEVIHHLENMTILSTFHKAQIPPPYISDNRSHVLLFSSYLATAQAITQPTCMHLPKLNSDSGLNQCPWTYKPYFCSCVFILALRSCTVVSFIFHPDWCGCFGCLEKSQTGYDQRVWVLRLIFLVHTNKHTLM